MKRRFSEEKIIKILKEAEEGNSVDDVCRKNNISRTSFYIWKKKFGGLTIQEARRLKILERENTRLKKIVADLSLKAEALKDALSKKW